MFLCIFFFKVADQQGIPEGMTVVAALQPQDLQLMQAAQLKDDSEKSKDSSGPVPVALVKAEQIVSKDGTETVEFTQASGSNTTTVPNWQSITTDYLSRMPQALPMTIHQFLKFSAETIKRESQVESSPLSTEIGEG